MKRSVKVADQSFEKAVKKLYWKGLQCQRRLLMVVSQITYTTTVPVGIAVTLFFALGYTTPNCFTL